MCLRIDVFTPPAGALPIFGDLIFVKSFLEHLADLTILMAWGGSAGDL